MILVDTSIWADHIDRPDQRLAALLMDRRVLIHPFVIGELALGHLRRRADTLDALDALPAATAAFDDEVLDFIDRHDFAGAGIGYVDAHLLAAAKLTRNATLWSRDRRLRLQAEKLGIAFDQEAT